MENLGPLGRFIAVTVSVRSEGHQDRMVPTQKAMLKPRPLSLHHRWRRRQPSPRGPDVWGHAGAGLSFSIFPFIFIFLFFIFFFPFYFCTFVPCRALVSAQMTEVWGGDTGSGRDRQCPPSLSAPRPVCSSLSPLTCCPRGPCLTHGPCPCQLPHLPHAPSISTLAPRDL